MFNYHTHTHFCDGKGEPEQFVEKAISLGFHSLGFSGHAYLPSFKGFCMTEEGTLEYCKIINALKNEYQSRIEIYLALEIDFTPGVSFDFDHFRNQCDFDYFIGSVHLVTSPEKEGLWFTDGKDPNIYDQGLNHLFNGNIREAVTAYYKQIQLMVRTQKPSIVGHLDKIKMHNNNRYFSEDEKWYVDLVEETLQVIKENLAIVEINTRGIYKKRYPDLFPGQMVLRKIAALEIPVTISTDAHKPEELALEFNSAVKEIKKAGIHKVKILRQGFWLDEQI